MEQITAADRARFTARQKRLHPELFKGVDSLRGAEAEPAPMSFFDVLESAMGAPSTIEIRGLSVTVSSPTVESLKAFLGDSAKLHKAAESGESQDPAQAVEIFRPLLLGSLEFKDGQEPESVSAWLDKLRLHDLVPLAKAFRGAIDIQKLMGHVGDVSGNAGRVSKSPGRN